MQTLAHTASQLAAAATREDLFQTVLVAAPEVVKADAVHLGTLDVRRGVLRLVVNAGTFAEWTMTLPESERKLFADYPQLVRAEGPDLARRLDGQSPRMSDWNRSLLLALQAQHAMSVPVVVDGQCWGEIFFSRQHPVAFSDEEGHAAVVLAELLGTGLARLDNTEHLVDLAYTDALTGLSNRRHADEQLQAWAADPRARGSMAVALCDANELKAVNDELGHSTGDKLLVDLAALVRSASRRLPQGVAARIGGDEFLVAGLCETATEVNEVVADLTRASVALPLGSGLSCGTAWSGNLARMEATPADHVSALLRLADASQYEQKRSRRRAAALTMPVRGPSDFPVEGSADRPAKTERVATPTADEFADEVTSLLRRLRSGTAGDSLVRLTDVSTTLCEVTGAAAWWISSVNAATGTIVALRCGTPRTAGHSDGQWPAVVVDPTPYRLADYPATAAIISGGSFSVDTMNGEPAERHLLVQTGFASMIAAAGTDDDAATWLIEINGDALTPRLLSHRPLLEALMCAALATSRHRGSSERDTSDV
jgi:diguanylate cyclase (GGDEF)-like protein